LTIISDLSYMVGVFAALGIFIPRTGKSKHTYPRIGYIKFRGTRRKNITVILLGVFVLGLFAFFIFGRDQTTPLAVTIKDNFLIVIGFVWGGALASAAFILNVNRYFLYALLVFLGVALSDWIGALGLNLIIVGSGIIIVGILILRRFIRKYPIVEDSGD
jgi:hypothetical protein